jgi:hypothetical protein
MCLSGRATGHQYQPRQQEGFRTTTLRVESPKYEMIPKVPHTDSKGIIPDLAPCIPNGFLDASSMHATHPMRGKPDPTCPGAIDSSDVLRRSHPFNAGL